VCSTKKEHCLQTGIFAFFINCLGKLANVVEANVVEANVVDANVVEAKPNDFIILYITIPLMFLYCFVIKSIEFI
jgi:hypothetical protein